MATKHLCDRCNKPVETKEEFLILQIGNAPGQVARQADNTLRMELCANCAVAVSRFARDASRDTNVDRQPDPRKAGIHVGTTVLGEGVVVEEGPAGRLAPRVKFEGLDGDVHLVNMPLEKLHKVYDVRYPVALPLDNKETK